MSAYDENRGGLIGPTSNVYFSQRLRLHYVDWGNRDAEPLLLIHGGRDHCRNWDWVAEALRHDYHVIAPDLRGHGDSAWHIGGNYQMLDFVYDIAQLVDQRQLAPLRIVAHSLGGNIALHYAGLYPENVRRLVAIEGLGPSPAMLARREATPTADRITEWIDSLRRLSGRLPRRYETLEKAFLRMQEENPHLTAAQARHLTVHGSLQNEDGTYSWKFDNYMRVFNPVGLDVEASNELLARITAPVLLFRGTESWASDPVEDGRIRHFHDARLVNVEGAGHWVHHDQLELFLDETRRFLADG